MQGTPLRSRAAVLLAGALFWAPIELSASPPLALGPDFQVNAYTTGNQLDPSVSSEPGGGFLVAWYDSSPELSARARAFSSAGEPLGGDFALSESVTSIEFVGPGSVATHSSGDFMGFWATNEGDHDTDGYAVLARRFSSDGTPDEGWGNLPGGAMEVNSHTPGDQYFGTAAVGSDGNFLVVWQSFQSSPEDDDSDASIQGQILKPDGAGRGGQFQINTATTYQQAYPTVAALPSGQFVVVWQCGNPCGGTDTDYSSVRAVRLDDRGDPLATEFQVNTSTTQWQERPAVSSNAAGDFLVTWTEFTYVESIYRWEINGRLFDSVGLPYGDGFVVASTPVPDNRGHMSSDSTALPDGSFMVVWETDVTFDAVQFSSIYARRVDGSGSPVGTDFQVNSWTTGSHKSPQVAAVPGDRIVVTWEATSSPGEDPDYSILARRFLVDGLFVDGFESGDLSAW